jgi:cell wall assembly regulator SMI1
LSSLLDFALWEPLLRIQRDANLRRSGSPAGLVRGSIGWYLREGLAEGSEPAAAAVTAALRAENRLMVDFTAEISEDNLATVSLHSFSSAVESRQPYAESLLLVEGALPQPWRRLPEPTPDAVASDTVDLVWLDQMLRGTLPGAVGATEEEIAAAEARLGLALPDELKVFYRVWNVRAEDGKEENHLRLMGISFRKLNFEPLSLDAIYVALPATRPISGWHNAARMTTSVDMPLGAKVQALVGSPGWIAFADSGGGDPVAVDLTPGPAGHLGQIIMLCHEEEVGAIFEADSLTAYVARSKQHGGEQKGGEPPRIRDGVIGQVGRGYAERVEDIVHPDLEVLTIERVNEGVTCNLAPLFGLPHLRTLAAQRGALTDPLEIRELTSLEFLELGSPEWRVLLEAGAIPRSLLACRILVGPGDTPAAIGDLANEILELWDGPRILRTIIEGSIA